MSKIKQLGNKADFPKSPSDALLETVINPHNDKLYLARFSVPEFTSLCPVTGQPDFANIIIDYIYLSLFIYLFPKLITPKYSQLGRIFIIFIRYVKVFGK